MINETAEFLVEEIKRLMDQSKIKIQNKPRKPDKKALDTLEEVGEDIMRKQKAAKGFFNFVKEFTSGIDSEEGKVTPTLEQFQMKAQDKLRPQPKRQKQLG